MLFEKELEKKSQLINGLISLFNNCGVDTATNIPDHILAAYVYSSLENLRETSNLIDNHYGFRKLNGQIIKKPKDD